MINDIASAPVGAMPDPQHLTRAGWTVRQASRRFELSYLTQLVDWRELLFFFVWRDLKLKNKQMLLGMGWTILQPIVQMLLFSIVLGRFAGLPSEKGLPYSLLVFAGLLPWQYFSASLSRCTQSLVNNQLLLTKAAFPRLLLPAAAVLSGVVDLVGALAVLAVLMLWFQVTPAWTVIFLPMFLMLTPLTALAVGLWLSALGARYRDVAYLLPFILQAWMLATPVGYSVEIVPAGWTRQLYELNPMAVIVKGVRWSLFGTAPVEPFHLISLAAVALVLVTGVGYFRRVERTLADVI